MIIDPRLIGTDDFPAKSFAVMATFATCDGERTIPLSHYYTTVEEAVSGTESVRVA